MATPSAVTLSQSTGASAGRSYAIVLLLLAVTAAAFWPVLNADFTSWDDPKTVSSNPRLNPPTLEGTLYFWSHPHMDLYIPLTYSVWAATGWLAQVPAAERAGVEFNPYLFHLLNLLVHAGAVLAVWGLLWKLVKSPWAAMAGALLFAVHPLQVEAVAWVSGLKDLLCGLLGLLAVRGLLELAQAKEGRGWVAYGLGTVAYAGAMLSKPAGVVVPVVGLVAVWWSGEGRWTGKKRLAVGLWLALAVPCIIWTRLVQYVSSDQIHSPLWSRPLVALDALAFYLYKLVFPMWLGVDYGRNPQRIIAEGWIYWTWILPVAVGVAIWLLKDRRRGYLTAALFIVPLLPVLGFVPFDYQYISTVTDHYLYLSMLAPALALAWLLARNGQRWPLIASLAILAAFAVRTHLQIGYWRDSRALFEHAAQVNPRGPIGYWGLANYYDACDDLQMAEKMYRASLAADSGIPPVHTSLAMLLVKTGRMDEAIDHLRDAVNTTVTFAQEGRLWRGQQRYHLAILLRRRGRLDEAIQELQEAVRLRPQDAQIQRELEDALKARSAAPRPTSSPGETRIPG